MVSFKVEFTPKFGLTCTTTKELKNHKQTSGNFSSKTVISQKGRKMEIEELIGVSFKGIAFCNLSALYLNSNNKSVRLVAEDIGVFKIHERKSAFDAFRWRRNRPRRRRFQRLISFH